MRRVADLAGGAARWAAIPLVVSACAPQSHTPYEANDGTMILEPFTVYQGTRAPLSHQPATGKDVGTLVSPVRVTGKSCQSGLWVPFLSASAGWGDGGYRRAMREAQESSPAKDAIPYDVRADVHIFSVLGVWRQECVVVDAAVAVPRASTTPPAPAPAPPAGDAKSI